MTTKRRTVRYTVLIDLEHLTIRQKGIENNIKGFDDNTKGVHFNTKGVHFNTKGIDYNTKGIDSSTGGICFSEFASRKLFVSKNKRTLTC